MSKLYDAIKKLENKKNQPETKDNPFVKPRKENNTKRLVVLGLVSFFLLFVGFFAVDKFTTHNVKKTKKVKSVVVKDTANARSIDNDTKQALKNKSVVEVKVNKIVKIQAKPKIERQEIKKPKTVEKSVYVAYKEEKPKTSKNKEPSVSVANLIEVAENGNDTESISAYKKLIKIFPENLDLYNNLAVRYMNLGKYDEAIKILKKALSIGDSVDVKLNYTLALVKVGRLKEAREVIRTIDVKEVKDKELYYALISVLFSRP
ncbi:tetratricopeptide repeat protein [Hippea alviniae]|uniref:tetratricopeptide repeat protein n=1 Tax=Hippea alviniae TaxID=1279027 RepID=UPI0003B7A211|nr:tetratricopeptide repeat protein [Hippea alviniae]